MASLDVLICTYERPDHVVQVVEDVLPQLGADDAVTVLDQSRRVQPTRAALHALGDPRVGVHAAPPRGLPAARNAILAMTRRPLVVFLDDDVRLEPGCLEAHRHALVGEGIGATVGRIDERSMAWNARSTGCRVDRLGRVRVRLDGDSATDVGSVKGCNMGFRRQVLQQVGGFDPGFGGTALLEETDVSERIRRVGWRIRYLPDAALVHLGAPSGGVRQPDPHGATRWRFHNTGRFLARHRGLGGVMLGAGAYAGLAVAEGLRHGQPELPLQLWGRFLSGVAHAR